MTNQHITDATNKYFCIMPNMTDEDLDPYQYRLYGHYKRVCGDSGSCWESTRTTATKTKMSIGKVTTARRELQELGYIRIDESGKTLNIRIVDIMPINIERFSKCSPHEQECSPHEPKKNKEEEPQKKNIKNLSAPLSSESVPDDLDNTSQDNQSSDNIQFIIDITAQLSQLKLTTSQRTVLTAWLIGNAHNPDDFAPYTGKKTQVMNNLVKQGYLSTDGNGNYSTRLECTQPKSILFSLTYADMGETPPAGKKDTDKPFWEGVAAMYCWNDNGLDDWRKYVEVASREQLATLNAKIKDTCLALDALHLDDPFSVEEFRWIINHWLHTKFKTVPISERRFAVSGEAIANNWNAMRVSFKLYKQGQADV